MKFGPLKLAEAEGAILAHSQRLDGRKLGKGHILSATDLDELAAAGVGEVVAARLDPDEVGEDEAARTLAEALVGEGVRVDQAFTGRVNQFATKAGVCRLERAAIDRLNAVDEAITVATLPAFEPVEPGRMVATIKIIPFAVPRERLDACLAIAREAAPVVAVAPYRRLRVHLIQTELPVVAAKVLDKTARITAERIEAVGGELVGESRVPHATDALAREIERVRATEADLLLIAGASAITDRRDVLPAAIEASGGRIDHFGMPVDPGNLLLLAEAAGRPVLGLPGCARSPKLNGFDWVLRRLAAGLPIGRADITAMGVGGLLMEIPSRPQPRTERPKSAAPGPRVAALVLAAGQSRRMGVRNKLLAPIDGKPMVAHVVDAALASRVAEVVVVTGHEDADVRAALAGRRVRFVANPNYTEGLSTSLGAGLAALGPTADGALVCLGDMPRITAAQLDRLIAAFDPGAGRGIVVPTVRGKRGNPVLWARGYFDEMQAVAGDVGARHLIGRYPEAVAEVAIEDEAPLLDVDTPEALARLVGETPAP
jgi:molybdenum cofactor cytidylyltransferase